MNLHDRARARVETIRFRRVLLTALGLPFYAAGRLVGCVWYAVRWVCVSVQLGVSDGATRTAERQ